MLPDFPSVRSFLDRLLNEWLERRIAGRLGVFNLARRVVVHEGDRMRLRRFDGSVDEKGMEEIRSSISVVREKLAEEGLAAVLSALEKTAEDVAAQQSKLFIKRVEEAVQEAGQVVDAEGQPLTFDLVLDMLDKMLIDFDEQGRPKWPSVVCGAKAFEKAKNWEITDEQERRLSELTERKRLEWRDGESDRKLVG